MSSGIPNQVFILLDIVMKALLAVEVFLKKYVRLSQALH